MTQTIESPVWGGIDAMARFANLGRNLAERQATTAPTQATTATTATTQATTQATTAPECPKGFPSPMIWELLKVVASPDSHWQDENGAPITGAVEAMQFIAGKAAANTASVSVWKTPSGAESFLFDETDMTSCGWVKLGMGSVHWSPFTPEELAAERAAKLNALFEQRYKLEDDLKAVTEQMEALS